MYFFNLINVIKPFFVEKTLSKMNILIPELRLSPLKEVLIL